jgi:hypothetical protein
MEFNRKEAIWYPTDAEGLEGKNVICFDSWYDKQFTGIYLGKSGDHDYPFEVEYESGAIAYHTFIVPFLGGKDE